MSSALSTLLLLFAFQKFIPVTLLSVLLGANVVCMLRLTQHIASHLVILTMEDVSRGRNAAWSTRHAMNSHAHHGLSVVSYRSLMFYVLCLMNQK